MLKLFKKHFRDLELFSSERRRKRDPKAPKRFVSEKVIFVPFGIQKWKIWSEMRKSAEITLLHHGAKRLVNVMVFGYF